MHVYSNTIYCLADLGHRRWARWMKYLFTKGTKQDDGSFIIDAKSVALWEHQMCTNYSHLDDTKKSVYRKEAVITVYKLLSEKDTE